jgi:DNA-binding CsgD family transcriptional regulator
MNQGEFCRATGHLVEAIGFNAFPKALTALLRQVVPFSFTVAFAFRGAARPETLFDDFPADRRQVFVTDYLEGPYLLDPFFLAATRPVPAGLHRLRDLAPDRFFQGEYYRSYYARTGLAEEIGLFIDLAPGLMVVVSLMREERVFSGRDMQALNDVTPILLAAGRRHWADMAATTDAPAGADQGRAVQVDAAFSRFGRDVLTPREREVVEHTLKGHSAEAIGGILGIAPGTVRIHRGNVYAKLGITSQGELFSRFIQTLGRA